MLAILAIHVAGEAQLHAAFLIRIAHRNHSAFRFYARHLAQLGHYAGEYIKGAHPKGHPNTEVSETDFSILLDDEGVAA